MRTNNKNVRVVVTGIGVVSSIGIGVTRFWKNLLAGTSGVTEISSFDASPYKVSIGGEIKDFEPEKYIDRKNINSYGRTSQLGIAAARLAVEDSGLDFDTINDNHDVSIVIGTTNGESQVMEKISDSWVRDGENAVNAADVLKYPGDIIAQNIALEIKKDAQTIVIPTACAAGNYAIGYGYDAIKYGNTKVAIVGGCDSFSRIAFTGFNSIFAVAPRMCQPFDKNRKGIVVGEGAGILILESYDDAIKRNAHIYAEIIGYGLSCDANHMTIPNLNGVSIVMQKAMNEAHLNVDDVDYISAHGTGTPMNDKTESQAINRIFGSRKEELPVSSIKSMLGHTMGAASALEGIACALVVQNNQIPPTINYEAADPECPVYCVPNKPIQRKVRIALNNAFAFGGNNSCVVFKKINRI